MSLILSGTDGLSDVDGSASTPAIRGTDANTGIFFPAADTIAFSEGGVENMRIDSNGNVNIKSTTQTGTTSSLYVKQTTDTGFKGLTVVSAATEEFAGSISMVSGGALNIAQSYLDGSGSYQPVTFSTSGSERMRIQANGDVIVGSTSKVFLEKQNLTYSGSSNYGFAIAETTAGGTAQQIVFYKNGSAVGSVTSTTGGTAFNTSSDYRLKENIAPMTGALATVSALKPCTYTWKADGSQGQGFIAHELQAVVPDAVTGKKDGTESFTDEDGVEHTRPKYQGIDTSFLVATLTAAIQELKSELDSVKVELVALKA
jgi:hypothetical protein